MTIVFDIEWASPEWTAIDATTQHALLTRAARKTTGESAEVILREAQDESPFAPGLSPIVCIGLLHMESGRAMAFVNGSPRENEALEVDGRSVQVGYSDEKEMLEAFWAAVSPSGKAGHQRLVTFNGRGADGPQLHVRSAMLGVQASRNLVPYRHSVTDHCDVADVLTWFGATRANYSLEYYAARFGVASPKDGGLDGAGVAEAYRAGRLQDIARYCMRDVYALGEIYKRLDSAGLIRLVNNGRG